MPAGSGHIEQERPAVELAVDRALLANRWNDVVEHVLRDVGVPWLDDVGLDHRRHLDERRLADIDVPGTLAVLRLCHEAFDAKALNRRDLVVDTRELLVHPRYAGMIVLDPLVEGRRQRAVLGKGRSDAGLRHGGNAGKAEARGHGPCQELPPIDVAGKKLPARCLLDDVLKFLACGHRFPLRSVPTSGKLRSMLWAWQACEAEAPIDFSAA